MPQTVALSALTSGQAIGWVDGVGRIAGTSLTIDGNLTVQGTTTSVVNQTLAGSANITTSSATALSVAKAGTNYALQVDTAAANAATGLKITSAAAGGGVAIAAISSGAAEAIALEAKGAGSIAIGGVSTGDVLLGGAGGSVGINVAAPATRLHLAETVTTSPRGIMSSQHNTGTDGARFHMRKSRGTLAAPTVVVSGDVLGRLVASGYDGAAYQEMAAISLEAEGTINGGRVPTRISFYTATNASPSVLTERLQIDSSGRILAGTTVASGILRLGGTWANATASQDLVIDATNNTTVSGQTHHGIVVQPHTTKSNNNVDTVEGIRVALPTLSGAGGTFQSLRGMTIADMSGAARNINLLIGTLGSWNDPNGDYSIYSASTKQSYIAGKLGLGALTPTNDLSLGGSAARKVWMERHTTAGTAGNSLTIEAGGATIGATNKAGGDLILTSGISTGTGASKVQVQARAAGGSGTSDNAAVTVAEFDGDAIAGNTRMTLYDVNGAALYRVRVGANSSGPGGSGRALYIDDTP